MLKVRYTYSVTEFPFHIVSLKLCDVIEDAAMSLQSEIIYHGVKRWCLGNCDDIAKAVKVINSIMVIRVSCQSG